MNIKKLSTLFFLLTLTFLSVPVNAQSVPDNKGTDFVFAFPQNYQTSANLLVYLSSELDGQGTIEIPGLEISPGVTFAEEFSVTAGEVTTIQLPAEAEVVGNGVTSSLGIHLVSDVEVTVYALSRIQYTTDAFMALPTDVLSQEYIVNSYDGLRQFSIGSQLTIVGAEDGTSVIITPSSDVNGHVAGVPFFVELNRFDVYQISVVNGDMTGSVIESTRPVAVLGGHQCADVPSPDRSPTGGRIGWCDHIVEMLPPTTVWGYTYSVVPLASRNNGSIVRVIASENGTVVKIGDLPDDAITLNRAEFHEFVVTDYTEISATSPIMVSQYSPGQAFDNVAADPFMMVIPPNEQFLDSYTFAVPEQYFITDFVNIVAPTNSLDTLVLDGAPVDASLFSIFGNSGMSGAQIALTDGQHSISGTSPFGIYVYGFNSYESYGYPGGMAFSQISPISDSYTPNIGALVQIGRSVIGQGNDSEDLNVNGILDAGEDQNGNGILDRRTEDLNGNLKLDPGEDLNGNNVLDRDRGLLKVDLLDGSTNLTVDVIEFISGQSPVITFRIDLINETLDGSGRIRLEDLSGNATEADVFVSSTAVLADVQLVSTVSGDRIQVDQASFSTPPYAVDIQPNQTVIEWRFDAINVGQIEDIGFDVDLIDPEAGEQRLVTQNLSLSYYNAIGGERITTVLGPQYVNVGATSFALATTIGNVNYGPNDDISIQSVVTNLGTANNSATVEVTVEDINGITIASLPVENVDALAPNQSASIQQIWNTGSIYTGAYRIRAVLKNDSGDIVNQTVTSFSIVSSTTGLPTASVNTLVGQESGGVFIEKTEYHVSDLVNIQSRIINVTSNTILGDALLQVTVLNPNGQTLFSNSQTIGNELLPGAVRDIIDTMVLDNALPGAYQVEAIVQDAATSAILANSNTSFTVIRKNELAVDGSVSANYSDLLRGEVQTCTYTVNNLLTSSISALPVRQSLVNISTQEEIQSRNVLLDIDSQQSDSQTHQEISGVIPGGEYACVLQVSNGNGYTTLSYAPFTVFSDVSQSLVGNVTAEHAELLRGDQQVCTYELSSKVSTALTGLEVHQSLLNTDLQQTVTNRDLLMDVQPGQPTINVQNEDTGASAVEGHLSCEFHVTTTSGLTRLGGAPFEIFNLIADPGADQTAYVGETVNLDGTGSRDSESRTLVYNWTFVSTPANSTATLDDPASSMPSFYVDEQGSYIVELVINNGEQDSLPKRVVITVPNRDPIADAGADQAIAVGDNVVLDGTGSYDLDGDTLNYQWTILQRPDASQAQLSAASTINPTITIDVSGVYIVALVVNDGFVDSTADTVLLNVGNVPPIADTGDDFSALVGDFITLDGSGSSDANGDMIEYAWNFTSLPAGSNAALQNTATARPFFTVDMEGEYVISLRVNDGLEMSEADTVRVTVGQFETIPVAEAGPDQSGYIGTTVYLDGSGSSDLDGDSLTYRWNLLSGPTGSNAQLIGEFTSSPQLTIDVQGDYIVQLIVSDGTNDSRPDTVFITGGNLRPFAFAEYNEVGVLYTGATVTLDGTSSYDPDGASLIYQWSIIDRPEGSIAMFDDETLPMPSFTIDVGGDYVLQLVVNDGIQDSEPSTVFIEGVQNCIDNLAIRPKFDKITLTWDFNPDVPLVEVERSTNFDGPYEVIAESDSTYSTYLDSGLDFGPVYYYRIRGVFGTEENTIVCEDVGEGVICGEAWCDINWSEEGMYLSCGDGQYCDVIESNYETRELIAQCDGFAAFEGTNRCPPDDFFCMEICSSFVEDPGMGEEMMGGEFDFNLCLPPVSTQQNFCETQIIASTPIGRVRTASVPDLRGMSVEQAQTTLQQNLLAIGSVTFERTTSVPAGQVIRQDMPRNSVMPYNTAIDIVVSTRGIE